MSTRFEKGDTVFMGRGANMRRLTVKEVIHNPLLPIRQYAFEEVDFVCGEQSIRDDEYGPDLTLSECMDSAEEIETAVMTQINTSANVFNQTIQDDRLGTSLVFFNPDSDLVHWLINYANGRRICDVGCGQGHLIRLLKVYGHKNVFGIEPNFDYGKAIKAKIERGNTDINEVLPFDVDQAKQLFGDMEDCLFIFARPCHSDFVERGISYMNDSSEALYITVPKNIELYQDLGRYDHLKVKLDHEGGSADKEVIYSVKKK